MDSNPFENLEKEAKRMAAGEQARKALLGARGTLMWDGKPATAFFSHLLYKLQLEESWDVETGDVDGKKLRYNPDFVNSTPIAKCSGFLVHEVMHCALDHPARRGNRELERYNEAADLAVNSLIRECGIQLPDGALFPGEGKYAKLPKGLSVEAYYDLLSKPPEQQKPRDDEQTGGGDGGDSQQGNNDGEGEGDDPSSSPDGANGTPDPGKCGGVRDSSSSPAERSEVAGDWKVAVAQAAAAGKQRGTMPGGLAAFVEAAEKPKTRWQDVLLEFLSVKAKNGLSWNRPNKRLLQLGFYWPSRFSRKLGRIIIMVDVSGSMWSVLPVLAAEIEDILGAYDCTATILYHDVGVTKVTEWTPEDGPLKFEPVGGGGTSHEHVFQWVEENAQDATAVVALTDGYTSYPSKPADCPTLWAFVGDNEDEPPFGQLLRIGDL